MRDLVVGVAVPSDLAGSIIVKILHSGESGDVSNGSNLETNSLVFAIAHLSLSIVFIYLA